MHHSDYHHSEADLIKNIAHAIDGEYSAITCYEQLASIAPNAEQRNRILEIRNDEIRHYHTFSHIYHSLTGEQYTPHLIHHCPTEYIAGLHFAFKDEQETVDFYLDIFQKASNPYIKEQFKRAAADEQNHAVWFLYFLMQNK